ncbi:TPA: hypothetical protein ACH3X1_008876 [Trebouxia sp. C0004]
MANYYHEARAHAKNIKHMQDDNRRRAERRAEKAGVEAELPINLLRIDGRSCSVSLNDEQYQAVQGMEGMIPMNGQQDNLIDRFDGRALLDFYREPAINRQTKPRTEDELELEELLAFETYRDLVKLLQQNVSEEQGLIAAELRNIEERASARSAAAAAVGIQPGQNAASSSSGVPAGQGEFSAVGFSYGASADGPMQSRAGGPIEDLGEEASSESSGSDDEEQDTDQTCDLLAANLGIDHFSVMLRRADKQEEDEALGQVKRPKRLFSRKKAAQRAKRMAGQGAGTWGSVPALAPARGLLAGPRPSGHSSTHRWSHRDSPTYDYHGRKRSRSVSWSRSRSRSPRRSLLCIHPLACCPLCAPARMPRVSVHICCLSALPVYSMSCLSFFFPIHCVAHHAAASAIDMTCINCAFNQLSRIHMIVQAGSRHSQAPVHIGV